MQAGPTEEDLEVIKAIHNEDQRAHIACKQEREHKCEAKKTASADKDRRCMETEKGGEPCAPHNSVGKPKAKHAVRPYATWWL